MRKSFYLVFLLVTWINTISASAQIYLTEVNVSKAGSLEKELGNRPDTIVALKINGNINETDISLLRRMSGFGEYDVPKNLRLLDLSDANILPDHVISSTMFGYCWCLTYLILPKNTTRIESIAFVQCVNLLYI